MIMRIILFSGILLCFLASCNERTTLSETVYPEVPNERIVDTLNIEKFALDFYNSHRDLNKNSITREEAKKEFQKEFKKSVRRDSLLKGIPVELRKLTLKKNGQCVAHFWCDKIKIHRNFISPFDAIGFDYIVTLPKDVAITLEENSKYILDVEYISHVDNISTFQKLSLDNGWVWTEDFELKPNDNDKNVYSINLGMMMVDYKGIHQYVDIREIL